MVKKMKILSNIVRRSFSGGGVDKAVVTASLNGVFTDPKKFNIPVSAEEMAVAAKESYDAGATVVHIHIRNPEPGKGHLPSWEPSHCKDVVNAIKERAPELIINMTTGTIGTKGPLGGGDLGPTGGPISCLEATMPDMAALNAGSLNYLKAKKDGTWAWDPVLFSNPVSKVEEMVNAMKQRNIVPECECFDTGIVRSIRMYEEIGLLPEHFTVSLVMGVASGMSNNSSWIPLLVDELSENARRQWQVIAIGRQEVWPLLRRAAELGGNVRTGLEDTFYLPDGKRAGSNGELIEALVRVLRESGREPATPDEARAMIGVRQSRGAVEDNQAGSRERP